MIPHHEQAILLSTLAHDRTNSESILDLAKRIESSQHDEILFMKDWLGSRGEESHHIKMSNHHIKMMGMATKTQIEELSALNGFSFDDLFLRLMIAHHRGAIQMV